MGDQLDQDKRCCPICAGYICDSGTDCSEKYPPLAIKSASPTEWQLGYIQAMCDYAVWRDGKRYIGVSEKPLKDAIAEFLINS